MVRPGAWGELALVWRGGTEARMSRNWQVGHGFLGDKSVLRHLAGARTVLERGMTPGWGLREVGILAKLELAQPVAGLRGRGRQIGFRQLFCPLGGEGSCTRLWGLLQVAHSGLDAHLSVYPEACLA